MPYPFSVNMKLMDRSELRAEVIARSGGRCEWSRCVSRGEQMAHIRGAGMGGVPSRDHVGNVAWLCVFHHDLLDGRGHVEFRNYELRSLLEEIVAHRHTALVP